MHGETLKFVLPIVI